MEYDETRGGRQGGVDVERRVTEMVAHAKHALRVEFVNKFLLVCVGRHNGDGDGDGGAVVLSPA